jgi:hypothetical protein
MSKMSKTIEDVIREHHYDVREQARWHNYKPNYDFVVVPGTAWGDDGSSTYDRSNNRVVAANLATLDENYISSGGHPAEPEVWVLDESYSLSGSAVLVRRDLVVPDGLTDGSGYVYEPDEENWSYEQQVAAYVAGVIAYQRNVLPVLDEDDLSSLESDMIEEAWEEYGRRDVARDLNLDDDTPEEEIDRALVKIQEAGDGTVRPETATSVYFGKSEDYAEFIDKRWMSDREQIQPDKVPYRTLESLLGWCAAHKDEHLSDMVLLVAHGIGQGKDVTIEVTR